MKKVLVVGVITILTMTALTGCNWFQPKEEPKDEKSVTEDRVMDEEESTDEDEMMDEEEEDDVTMEASVKEMVEDFENYEVMAADDFKISCQDPEMDEALQAAVADYYATMELHSTDYTNLSVFITGNPEGYSTEKFKETFEGCFEGAGSPSALKAYDEYLLWGFPFCTAGAKVSSKEADKAYEECEPMAAELREYSDTTSGEVRLEGEYEASIGMVADLNFTDEDGRFIKFEGDPSALFDDFGLNGGNCLDCKGRASIVVMDIQEIPGPGESTYEATLVEVLEASEPVER